MDKKRSVYDLNIPAQLTKNKVFYQRDLKSLKYVKRIEQPYSKKSCHPL